MLVTGDLIDAKRAHELGLVNRVVAEDVLAERTKEMAELVASKLGSAVKIGKGAFYRQSEMTLDDPYTYVSDVMVENMLFAQTEKGIEAFLKKEKPTWDQ